MTVMQVDTKREGWWQNVINHPHTSYVLTRLTQFSIPEAETFNLLGEEVEGEKKVVDRSRPVTHIRSRYVWMVTVNRRKMLILMTMTMIM